MRTQLYKIIFFLNLLIAFACVQGDEFEVPAIEIQPVDINGTFITIEALRDALAQEMNNNGNPVLTFSNDNYIAGYVISNDQMGNFFEELVIQDAASGANRGVKLLIDSNPLFQRYQFGRKIYVKLNGLTVGLNSGVLTLGIRDGNRIAHIPESQLFDFIIRDIEVAEIQPVEMSISALNDERTNTYIRLHDVQFHRNIALGENRLTYAGEPQDQFDGERLLESCSENATLIFSTSVFADFKSVLIAQGRGSIDGIFTYNFFGDEFNIVVNDLNTVALEDTDRCDPPEVNCGIAANTGSQMLFSEFFETQSPGSPISGNGWTNYIEAGTETWEAYSESGTNASLGISARMGSYGSGDPGSVGWLISPEIDFNAGDEVTLSFKTSNSFADGSTLEVLISQDWDGDSHTIPSANWHILAVAILVQDDDFFGDWIPSGNVSLNCVEGSGHIAWKYTGSGDEGEDGTYELDELEIRFE